LPKLRYLAFNLHHEVAFMFLKKTHETQYVVHHRNGIKWDNRAFNLMWTDGSQNSTFSLGYTTKVSKIYLDGSVVK